MLHVPSVASLDTADGSMVGTLSLALSREGSLQPHSNSAALMCSPDALATQMCSQGRTTGPHGAAGLLHIRQALLGSNSSRPEQGSGTGSNARATSPPLFPIVRQAPSPPPIGTPGMEGTAQQGGGTAQQGSDQMGAWQPCGALAPQGGVTGAQQGSAPPAWGGPMSAQPEAGAGGGRDQAAAGSQEGSSRVASQSEGGAVQLGSGRVDKAGGPDLCAVQGRSGQAEEAPAMHQQARRGIAGSLVSFKGSFEFSVSQFPLCEQLGSNTKCRATGWHLSEQFSIRSNVGKAAAESMTGIDKAWRS